LILQKTAGNWTALIHLMIGSDLIAALCWLYLNPSGPAASGNANEE